MAEKKLGSRVKGASSPPSSPPQTDSTERRVAPVGSPLEELNSYLAPVPPGSTPPALLESLHLCCYNPNDAHQWCMYLKEREGNDSMPGGRHYQQVVLEFTGTEHEGEKGVAVNVTYERVYMNDNAASFLHSEEYTRTFKFSKDINAAGFSNIISETNASTGISEVVRVRFKTLSALGAVQVVNLARFRVFVEYGEKVRSRQWKTGKRTSDAPKGSLGLGSHRNI